MSDQLSYSEKLRDPRWQKLRLLVFERDNWKCRACTADYSTLHVHHRWYKRGAEPWEYPLSALVTLCEECHAAEKDIREKTEAEFIATMRLFVLQPELFHVARLVGAISESAPSSCPIGEFLLTAVACYLGQPGRLDEVVEWFSDYTGRVPGFEDVRCLEHFRSREFSKADAIAQELA